MAYRIPIALLLCLLVATAGCIADDRPDKSSGKNNGPPPNYVFLGGEFRRTGLVPFVEGMTLVDLIIRAGGFMPAADTQVVVRHWEGAEDKYKLDSQGRPEKNPVLKPGDSVLSPQR